MITAKRVQVYSNSKKELQIWMYYGNDQVLKVELGNELATAMFDAMVPIFRN